MRASARVILLEEPELSLHAAVVRKLPAVLSRVTRRDGPQIILSTHSAEMLSDPGLGLDEVVVLVPDAEGTTARMASDVEGAKDYVEVRSGLLGGSGPNDGPLARLARLKQARQVLLPHGCLARAAGSDLAAPGCQGARVATGATWTPSARR